MAQPQLTLRGFGNDLERSLRKLARTKRVSLNRAALELMRRGAGLAEERDPGNRIGHDLDAHFGTWAAADAEKFAAAVGSSGMIDPEMWK